MSETDNIIDSDFVRSKTHTASNAWANATIEDIRSYKGRHVRNLVEIILDFRLISQNTITDRTSEITKDAAHAARWQSDNFSEKLTSQMKEYFVVDAFVDRMNIIQPTLPELIKEARIYRALNK